MFFLIYLMIFNMLHVVGMVFHLLGHHGKCLCLIGSHDPIHLPAAYRCHMTAAVDDLTDLNFVSASLSPS